MTQQVLAAWSRFTFLGTLVAAPWCFGGIPVTVQFWLSVGLTVSLGFWLLSQIRRRPERLSSGWSLWTTAAVMILVGFILLGTWQLLSPWASVGPAAHAVAQSFPEVPGIDWSLPAVNGGSLDRHATRLEAAGITWRLIALVLGAQLCAQAEYRAGLWLILSLNGALFAAFGIVQRLTWNDLLYWTVPLRFGGGPFAAYVNRNSAAGYLNICLAAGIGLLFLGVRRSPQEWMISRDGGTTLTFRSGLVLAILSGLVLGVVGSLSRGGVIAGGLALLAVWLWSLRPGSDRIAAGTMTLALGLGIGLGMGFGVWELAQQRFAGFHGASLFQDIRWRHWSDMANSMPDLWPSGAGLGSYRHAHRPYQNHDALGAFWNADNQYVEWAVEGGLPAVLLMLGGVVTICSFLWSAGQRADDEGGLWSDLLPVSLCLVVSQGGQAIADFGLEMPANSLALAAICGALTGGWRLPKELPERPEAEETPSTTYAIPGLRWLALPLAVCAALALAELEIESRVDRFFASIPKDQFKSPDAAVPAFVVEFKLAEGRELVAAAPDHAELLVAVGELSVLNFRQRLYRRMQEDAAIEKQSPSALWGSTHPKWTNRLCFQHLERGDVLAASLLRTDPLVVEFLRPAQERFQQAVAASPYHATAAWWLARLSTACSPNDDPASRRHWQARTIALAPCSPDWLEEIAEDCTSPEEDRLAAACWRRMLQLKPERAESLWKQALQRCSPSFLLQYALPENPRVTLVLASLVENSEDHQLVLARAKQQLGSETQGVPPGEVDYQLAWLAELSEDWPLACEHYAQAIAANPLNVDWRLARIRCLEASGRIREALQDLEKARPLRPEDPQWSTIHSRLVRMPEG